MGHNGLRLGVCYFALQTLQAVRKFIGKIKFVLVKNSLYICIMKRQIQSYISEEDYSKLKLIAEKEGLLFATLIRQIILNYLKTKNV